MPELKIFATAWGLLQEAAGPFPLSSLPALVRKLKSLGYSGIEIPITFVMKFGSTKFAKLLEEEGMLFIAQVFSSGAPPTPGNLNVTSEFGLEHLPDNKDDTRDVARHKAVWGQQVLECAKIRHVLHSVNSHTGKDYFTAVEADELFSFCVK